jgi:uncharacterized protein YacL
MSFEQIRLRILFVILVASVCYGIALNLEANPWIYTLIGGWVATIVVIAEKGLSRASIRKLTAGAIGLAGGLIVANLVAYPLLLMANLKTFAPLILLSINIVCASVGLSVSLKKEEDIFDLISYFMGKKAQVREGGYKILDTSVIIDGRISEICETGFLEGTLVIPHFVLTEVQQIADSAFSTKRARGKRGLDIVNKLQNQDLIPVEIVDTDFPEIPEVDNKLLQLAKIMDAKIVTNDHNLKKVAKIQNVMVLNINELATALKPVLLPGESLRINILKEGENPNQGVAYLEDGTMVVVEGGKKHIGKEVEVTVTSVLQTTTGKMIFTEVREESEKEKRRFQGKVK